MLLVCSLQEWQALVSEWFPEKAQESKARFEVDARYSEEGKRVVAAGSLN
jgi:hypothetical protein